MGQFDGHGASMQMNALEKRVSQLSARQRQTLSLLLDQEQENVGRKQLLAYLSLADKPSVELSEIREYLQARLPAYMIPESLTVLHALPRLPNGKVDVHALPDPQPEHPSDAGTHIEPKTEAERILAKIWCDVLGIDVLSVHDNFFEVGGDSLTSIQIVSRARDAGLPVQPRQLTDHPTVSGLAAAISLESDLETKAGRTTGDAPLTPIQHWFLSRKLAAPGHWNQAYLFQLDARLSVENVSSAIDKCLEHHDALRATFHFDGKHWSQIIQAAGGDSPLQIVEFDEFAAEQFDRVTEQHAGEFDLQRGPLIRFVLFNFPREQPNRLLVVAHHLVIDFLSWTILVADLDRGCQQLLEEDKLVFPEKTTSVIEWAEQLSRYAQSDECQAAASYWTSSEQAGIHQLPTDHSSPPAADEASATAYRFLLSDADTQLLTQANQAYNTQTRDLLLTALALTLTDWTKATAVRIDLEGHGREPVFDGIDIGRTVGWFTSFFPVTLSLPKRDSCAAIKSVKEQLRSLPNHGLDYGVLRYLADSSIESRALAALPHADVLFNFAGSGHLDANLRLIKPLEYETKQLRAASNARSHALEINAFIDHRRLSMSWIYSENLYRRATIQRLTQKFEESLLALITHCCSPEAGGFTPSDFPEVGLNQDDLDQFLDELD